MWRSGAPQRRGARGAFRGADAHTRCYEKCHCFTTTDEERQPSSSARDRTAEMLLLGRGSRWNPWKQSQLDRIPQLPPYQTACTYTPFHNANRVRVVGRVSVGRFSPPLARKPRPGIFQFRTPYSEAVLCDGISHNVPHVCDVAPRPTGPRGHVAERRAAAPRSPRRLPRRRCTYALLWDVASWNCIQSPFVSLAMLRSGDGAKVRSIGTG